ncbi:hypothetical protein E2C01_063307 [Portunus trituberculatus]|uniref:Uncharacterized protein n=1 Tax=Portunus trituberculatus TaxID=210409 RepID=A0A5B7HDB6_PORTR|nr:hypothetical protein [Portunus trituberculatus]
MSDLLAEPSNPELLPAVDDDDSDDDPPILLLTPGLAQSPVIFTPVDLPPCTTGSPPDTAHLVDLASSIASVHSDHPTHSTTTTSTNTTTTSTTTAATSTLQEVVVPPTRSFFVSTRLCIMVVSVYLLHGNVFFSSSFMCMHVCLSQTLCSLISFISKGYKNISLVSMSAFSSHW